MMIVLRKISRTWPTPCSAASRCSFRSFSIQDASAALRPFFFIVHPDLFGQRPVERVSNENSLKLLNEYLSHQGNSSHPVKPREVSFYIRSQEMTGKDLRSVKIKLNSKSLKETVLAILQACDLPSKHIEALTSHQTIIKWNAHDTLRNFGEGLNKSPNLTLRSWLAKNIERSKKYKNAVHHVIADVNSLMQKVQEDLGLKSVHCNNDWNLHHFRGCLKSFRRLCSDHPVILRQILKGKVLVFSKRTGVSHLGEVFLSSEDVPQRWLMLLLTSTAYDASLARLPSMESKLSSLLNNITIIHRPSRHATVMAEEYELLLNKLLNTLSRCQGHMTAAFKDEDLSSLQLAAEGACSPLMMSSTGQFLTPASIPGSILIDFIKENKEKALAIAEETIKFLRAEEEVRLLAFETLGLTDLTKDETVSPAQMTSCCTRLVEEGYYLSTSLAQCRLRISHYYSVMQDGELCIPWDWVGTND